MILATWVLVRTSPLRWWTLAGSMACLLLVAPSIGLGDTSMAVSAEAGFAVMLWAPASTLAGYHSGRQARLTTGADLLPLATRSSQIRRVVSVLVVPLFWSGLGWVGFWGAVTTITAPTGSPAYWTMSLNGLALSGIAVALGTSLAAVRAPAWAAGLAAGTVYSGLAVWSYVPDSPASILFSTYTPRFLSSALPSTHYLLAQTLWAATVVSLVVLGLTRTLGTGLVAASLIIVGLGVVTASSATDYVLPRSGNVPLNCRAHLGVNVCLWNDQEHARRVVEAEVALARRLVRGERLPALVVAQDQDPGPPPALPFHLHDEAVAIPASAKPPGRSIAAALVVATFRLPADCPSPRSLQELRTDAGVVLQDLVTTRVDPSSGARLDDRAISEWLLGARARVDGCALTEVR